MDEPVPIRRAAVGCLLIALGGIAFALVVRPAVFTFAPPRDDSAVVVATAAELAAGPVEREVVLSRAYGWPGERTAESGRVHLRVIVTPIRFGGVAAFAGASPGNDGCPIEIEEGRLADCAGRAWTLEGAPIEPAGGTPLVRFPVQIGAGSVLVDFTRTVDAAPSP